MELKPGVIYLIAGKRYAVCAACGSLVRFKPFLGTWHVCSEEAQ